MKLTFSWEQAAGRIIPSCSSIVVNKDGVSLLACVLMDDGGQSHVSAIAWIDEGIARIDAVIDGENSEEAWDREDWGVKLKPDQVVIYSLHDEDYMEIVDTPVFRGALVAWRAFLQSTPNTNLKREVEV
jgi:hypothetical protein